MIDRSPQNFTDRNLSRAVDSATNNRIDELQRQINDLKKRWPAHSTPPALMEQLDELEEALEVELRKKEAES